MNLLTHPWIPVLATGKTGLITLREVLCTDDDHRIAMSRDDMELACLQLMISLVQVLFIPDDAGELRQRIRTPMSEDEYEAGIQGYLDWFDLRHPETPFMQIRGVTAKEATPIQKLFPGLPEGNNHAFFNDPGEMTAISASAAAIALFNQAMNSPSFGGGFKGGFRGGAPITTLLSGDSLRQRIWFNVLHKQSVISMLPNYERLRVNDKPVWVDPVVSKSQIEAQSIGLLRGLFWQPAHVELIFSDQTGGCQFYGLESDHLVSGFLKEKFVYSIVGDWIHPHSPRARDIKTGVTKYRSFTNSAPAWTQLNYLLAASEDKKEGHSPAEVVRQFKRDLAQPDQLIVGGYRNKQASIVQRRHEYFPLRPGWDKSGAQIAELVTMATDIKTLLRNKLYGFAKATGAAGINEKAESMYYHRSEPLIHQVLQDMDWSQSTARLLALRDDLIHLSWDIFTRLTRPYAHEPKMIKALAVTKATLGTAFKKLKGDK